MSRFTRQKLALHFKFSTFEPYKASPQLVMGHLNGADAVRQAVDFHLDSNHSGASFAVLEQEVDPDVRRLYRPFLLEDEVAKSDWIAKLELSTALNMAWQSMLKPGNNRLKVLVLVGSLRKRSVG
jgi:arsenic resistance protein ArsH